MNKDRAAKSGDARPGVVIDFDDDVVEAIVTPKPVAWFIGRPPKWVVIAAVVGVFAPRVIWADPANREQGARTRQPIGAPP